MNDKQDFIRDNFTELREGETSTGRARGVCYCGKTPNRCSLGVKRVKKGLLFNCQSASCPLGGGCTRPTGFHNLVLPHSKNENTMQGTREKQSNKKTCALPDGCVRILPKIVSKWLERYFIGASEATFYDIMFDTTTKRTVFPIRNAGKLVAWSARRSPEQHEGLKWVHSKGGTGSLIYEAPPFRDTRQTIAILVEDPISAIRCAIMGYHTIAILGTSINSHKMQLIKNWWKGLTDVDKIVIILDADTWQHGKPVKIAKQLHGEGIPSKIVTTTKDPKELDEKSIRKMIDE